MTQMTDKAPVELLPDVTDLAGKVGRVMRRCAESWHTDEDWTLLAMLTLGIPEVWQAIKYRDRALARHVARPRVVGSDDLVCADCLTGWPCTDATDLGVA